MGDIPPRVSEGMPNSRYRAGSRSWPPSAVLPNRETHHILPHNIRIQAITLQYFRLRGYPETSLGKRGVLSDS
jgi:hypothetical protein